jgi:glycine dehydrogenase subunit 2
MNDEPTIFELSRKGRVGCSFPVPDWDESRVRQTLGPHARASAPRLPEVSEGEVVRHFVRLSTKNHHIDRGFYPLGLCTMKYNPRVNEHLARLSGFADVHPGVGNDAPGWLTVLGELSEYLAEIVGMDAVTLQPAAGAHGEFLGLLLMRAHLTEQGDPREVVLIPDSAHGTNPASVAMAGYRSVTVPSDDKGLVDMGALRDALSDRVAALMLTNPNTLGLFERNVTEICKLVHEAGGQVYMDGANLNALMGIARPGEMGFDVVHMNFHKTFSAPHGGGGPGGGALGVKSHLEPYLPVPVLVRGEGGYRWTNDRPKSVGAIHGFSGNLGVALRAYAYIRMLGPEGLRAVSEGAVLSANYLAKRLKDAYELPYDRTCMHEFVLSASRQKARGARAGDIAKRLLDYGFHAPTVYFPLIVPEALMIEPTESETKETLDAFADTMLAIDREVDEDPDTLTSAPHDTPVGRLDEGRAARELKLTESLEEKT